MSGSAPAMKSPDDYRDDHRKLMRAYAGFQMATALIVASKTHEICWAGLIATLFAVRIPSTIAYGGFARITPEDEQRNPGSLMAVCFCLAFLPSIAAISILLASASALAAIAFPITCAAWVAVTLAVRRNARIPPPGGDAQ
jgi:hypothetical protein